MFSARIKVTAAILVLALTAGASAVIAARDQGRRDAIMRADPETILANPELAGLALAAGRAGYAAHCASCHGPDGKAARLRSTPDLTDRARLYGAGVARTEQIILHGIRSGDPKGWSLAAMPAYATPRPYRAEPIAPLTPAGIRDVTQFVLSLGGRSADAASAARGAAIFRGPGGCYDCHGDDGRGDEAIGAPNLADDIWLYGDGSAESIARSIASGRAGICPAFARTLTAFQARVIAVYAASLSSPTPLGTSHD
jgi:cytochrome c oxidase cbb3-type subunit 3